MSQKKIIISGVVVGLIALILLGIRILSTPAEGEVTNTYVNKKDGASAQRATQHHQDDYIAFDYPAAYSKIKTEDAGPGYKVAQRLVGPSYKDSVLAVALKPGNTSSEPSVDQRQKNGALYDQKEIDLAGSKGYVFKKKGEGFEETVFVNRGSDILSISLTSPSGEDISNDRSTIVDSWRWIK